MTPTSYQTIDSPDTEPVKPIRVAVQVIEDPTATEAAEQTFERLVLAYVVICAVSELTVLFTSPL